MIKDDIRFLGTAGGKGVAQGSSSILVDEDIVIDAGNIINSLKDEVVMIEHIFLTHSHLDHITEIAHLIDLSFKSRKNPLKIYGLKETLQALKEHILNWDIWPDFEEIKLLDSELNSLEFIELELYKEYKFANVSLKPFLLNHTVPTCGYIIKKDRFSMMYATDTYKCDLVWDILNGDKSIKHLVIDVSFPSSMDKLAKSSKHLTPILLKEELDKLDRDDLEINVVHIKPSYYDEVVKELKILGLLKNGGRVLKDGDYLLNKKHIQIDRDSRILEISTALSKEKDLNKILDLILDEAISYTNSEGGTIYLKYEDSLYFNTVKNFALNIFNHNLKLPKIDLYPNNKPNNTNVSAVCAISKDIINIPDIYLYHIGKFNFNGTKRFDMENNYRTKSMLVIPMINQDDEVVGVMQLINKKTANNYTSYSSDDINIVKHFANLSASAITKNRLIDDLQNLIISFLESISYAISVKSPYGYEHISRVKELTSAIVKEINSDKTIFDNKQYTKEEIREIELAAWMHDIGKIATPEHILDKSSRLERLVDGIEIVRDRFYLIKESLRSKLYQVKFNSLNDGYRVDFDELDSSYEDMIKELDSDLEFLEWVNLSSTHLNDSDIKRVESIAKKSYEVLGKEYKLITKEELENLTIRYGTLNNKEREKIKEHVLITQKMLDMIKFPKNYKRVPEIASSHHEKLNGKGYPKGLKDDEISFEAQLLAVVDIFESLTTTDRPYKRAKTEDETFKILDSMVDRGEINADIVKFIKDKSIFKKFIEKSKVLELV